MADVPHFDLPFRFSRGRAVVNEQDEHDDVFACVESIVRYRTGQRPEAPEFGVPDRTFEQVPVDTDVIAAQIELLEPRAQAEIDQEYDPELKELIERIRA